MPTRNGRKPDLSKRIRQLDTALAKFNEIFTLLIPLAEKGERISDEELRRVWRLYRAADKAAGEWEVEGVVSQ